MSLDLQTYDLFCKKLLMLIRREQKKRFDPTNQIFSLSFLARKLNTSVAEVWTSVQQLHELGFLVTGRWSGRLRDDYVRISVLSRGGAA